jgi:P27 family predicted phage terminase small subunit
MRGRKPEPTALKLLRGNPGKRKPPVNEPTPAAWSSIEPPDWLAPDAREEWLRLAPVLERLGVITETDQQALTGYCETWATWKHATQQLRKYGMVIKGRDGDLPIISPFVKIAHNATVQMRAYLIEFGMTPSSRPKVHAVKQEPTKASKWAGML